MSEINEELEEFIGTEGKKLMDISVKPILRGYYQVAIYASFNEEKGIRLVNNITIQTKKTVTKTVKSVWRKKEKQIQTLEYGSIKTGIYAQKTEDGLFEMVTGRRLVVTDKPGYYSLRIKEYEDPIYCVAISELNMEDEDLMAKVGFELKQITESEEYKEGYIESINYYSDKARELQMAYEKQFNAKEKQKEDGLQFIKGYKLPEVQ